MGLQIRRGTEAERILITPAEGEIIYTTDTRLTYIGDGVTAGGSLVGSWQVAGDDSTGRLIEPGQLVKFEGTGGIAITTDVNGNVTVDGSAISAGAVNTFSTIAIAGQSNVVADSASDTLTLFAGTGITLSTNAGTDTITITNSGLSNVSDDLSPTLGGDLDLGGFHIVSSGGGDVILNPDEPGVVYVAGSMEILGNINKTGVLNLEASLWTEVGNKSTGVDGNLYLVRNAYAQNIVSGFTMAQHHNTPDATNLQFFRTRGSHTSMSPVQSGDDLGEIVFLGADSTTTSASFNPPNGAVISATVEGSPNVGHIPTRIRFSTNSGTGLNGVVDISSDGILKTNRLGAYSGTFMTVSSNVNFQGNVYIGDQYLLSAGGVTFGQDGVITSTSTNQTLTIRSNGAGTTVVEGITFAGQNISVSGTTGIIFQSMPAIPTYADESAANSSVAGSPVNGMMYYDTALNKARVYGNGSWHDMY